MSLNSKILDSNKKYTSNKIFGIGFPKTGTTSLNQALVILGYRSFHLPVQLLGYEIDGMPVSSWNRYFNCEKWDAITNFAESLYPITDKEFPNSKFILTIRDKKSWLKSVKNDWLKDVKDKLDSNKMEKLNYLFLTNVDFKVLNRRASTFHSLIYNEEIMSLSYDVHKNNVKNYFKRRAQDLLILDCCAGDGWEKLCPFLSKDIPEEPFPHLNKRL